MADIHIKNFRLKKAGRYYHVWFTSQNEEHYIGTCRDATIESVLGNDKQDYTRVIERWQANMEEPKPRGGYHGGAPPRKENKKQSVTICLDPEVLTWLKTTKKPSPFIEGLLREEMKKEESQ